MKHLTRSLGIALIGVFFCNNVCGQHSIIDAAQKSLPAIVTVTAKNIGVFKSPRASAAIDRRTGRLVVLRNIKTAQYDRAGAGVIIEPSGLIVTNLHTISKSNRIMVILNNKKAFRAKIERAVPEHDIAFIRIYPPYNLQSILMANSDAVSLNDEVISVGNSEFLKQTLSGGKIIGLGRSSEAMKGGNRNTSMIKTDIKLYKGDSGGAVLNQRGRLIGMMTASQDGKTSASFAIPSNVIKYHYVLYRSAKK